MALLRTLIVDDNQTMRNILRSVLNGYHGIEVVGEARTGEEALQQVQNLSPDLIILDISLPVLDGLSVAEVVRKNRPETSILIFSIHRIRDFVEATRRMGLGGFVCKDEGGQALLTAVDAVIDQRTYFPT